MFVKVKDRMNHAFCYNTEQNLASTGWMYGATCLVLTGQAGGGGMMMWGMFFLVHTGPYNIL